MKDVPQTIWRKSSHSGQEGSTCIELAELDMGVGVRDSVDPQGPVLHMGRDALSRLFEHIRTGKE